MDRFRRVAQVWDWLPAFRGVAEHGGITKAGAALATSPSALSRTVKVLEEALDAELFVRGPALSLTPAGERLLVATRNAMRTIDEGLPSPRTSDPGAVLLRIGVGSPAASAVAARSVASVAVQDLAVRTSIARARDGEALEQLLRGEIDLFVAPSAPAADATAVEKLGIATVGVYAAANHPLVTRTDRPSIAELADVPFAVIEGDDGWPIEHRRRIVATMPSIDGVLAFCQAAAAVTVLPDLLGGTIATSGLVRVADAGTQPLYATRRKPLELQDTRVVDAVLAGMRGCLVLTAGS